MSEDRNKQTQYPSEESSDSSSSEELTDKDCDDDESEASYDEVNDDIDSSEESSDNEKTPAEESSSYNSDDFDDDDDDESSSSNDSDRGEYVHGAIGPHDTGYRNTGNVNREETSQYLLNMKRNDTRDQSDGDIASEDSDQDSENKTTITIDVGTNTEVVKGNLTISEVEIEEFYEVKEEESIEGRDEVLEAENIQGTMYACSNQNNRTKKEAVMSQSQSVFYNESTQTDLVDVDPSGHHPVPCIQSEKNVDNIAEIQISKYSEKTTQTDALPSNPLIQSSQNTQTDGFLFSMTESTSEGTTQKNSSPLVSATEQSDITTSEITEEIVDDIIDSHISKYSQKTTQTDALLCNPVIQYFQETQTDGLLFDMTESSSEGVTVTDLPVSQQFLATDYPDMTTSEITKSDSSPRISTSQNPDMTNSENTKPESSPRVSATQHSNKTISTQPETLLTLIENLVQEEERTEDEAKTNEKYLDGSKKSEAASAESIQIDLEKGIPCNKFNNRKVIEMDLKIREERIPHKLKKARNKSLQRNIGNLNDSTKEKRQDPILLKKTKRKTRLCSAYNLLSRDMMTVRSVCQSHKILKGQGTAVSQAQYRMFYHYRWPQIPVTRF